MFPGGTSHGKGTYMSLYIKICNGPHDDDINWPFQQIISLEVLDLTGGGQHDLKTIVPGDDPECWQKPVDNLPRGYPKFIAHTDLNSKNCRFLVDDTICLRVRLAH